MVIVGALILLVGVYALLSTLIGGAETSTESYSGISRVDLDLDNASVQITGTGNEVVVDQRITSGLVATTVRHEVSGDTLRLVLTCPVFISINCEGHFVLRVPPGTGLTGRTANGRIELSRVDGPVDIGTSNGPIVLEGVSGSVRASTSNGAITATDLASRDVDLRTSNGRIEVDASQAPERIVARTSNGRIDIALPSDAAPFAVEVSTSNGSTSIDIRTDPASSQQIDARTSNGDIAIRYR